jgi:vesicle-fusing ATPase
VDKNQKKKKSTF